MHSTALAPAGKAVELESRDDGEWIKAKVVEPGAIKLTEEGVYSAFSIGLSRARLITDPVAKGGRIVDGIVTEVSLVDYPANPTCKFALTKAASIAVEDGVSVAEDWSDVGEHELIDDVHKAEIADLTKEAPEVEHVDLAAGESLTPEAEEEGAAGEEAEEVEVEVETEVEEPAPAESETEVETETEVEEPAIQLAEPAAAETEVEASALADVLKALHDATCPHSITKAAPEGVNAAMLQAVHASLVAELAEDGGTGSEAYDITWLADLYCDLVCWAECEAWDEIWDELLASAHDPEITKFAGDEAREKAVAAIRGVHEAISKGHPEFCETLKAAGSAPAPEVDVTKIVEEAVAKAMVARDATIAELTEEVVKLGGQPDPALAPHRGGTGGTVPVAIEEDTEELIDVAKAREGEDGEGFRQYLVEMTKHPSPEVRENARNELSKLTTAAITK